MIMMPIESSSKFQSEPKPQTLAEHQRSAALRATGTRLGESDEDCGAPLSIRTPPKPASSAYRVGGAAAAGRRPATRAPGAPPAKAYDLCSAAPQRRRPQLGLAPSAQSRYLARSGRLGDVSRRSGCLRLYASVWP